MSLKYEPSLEPLSLQSFLREGRVVGPCWEKLKPEGPKGLRSAPEHGDGNGDVRTRVDEVVAQRVEKAVERVLARSVSGVDFISENNHFLNERFQA